MKTWSAALTAVLIMHLAVTALRVEHLIASDIWILTNGRRFRRALDAALSTKSGRQRLSDPRERWNLYKANGAGRLPWLFFGVKSSRLMNMVAESIGVRRLLLEIVRGIWRFYTYVPASTLIVVTYLSVDALPRSETDDVILLISTSLLVLGTVAVAGDGVLASMRLGASARYHSLGWPPAKKEDLAIHELAVVAGSAIIALTATTSLVMLVGVRFNGYGSFGAHDGIVSQVWHAAFIALTAIVGQGFADPQNGLGVLSATLSIFVQISYVIILLGVTQKTWSK